MKCGIGHDIIWWVQRVKMHKAILRAQVIAAAHMAGEL